MIRATITSDTASERALRDWCHKNGWKVAKLAHVAPVGRPATPGMDLALAQELRDAGLSYRAIGAKFHLPEATVRYRLKSGQANMTSTALRAHKCTGDGNGNEQKTT
jgi:hypothetical protein